ncbi:hypothetical protein [Bacillus kexueae]|uniref:hypothetical protein n=1 Tax=Aeribacillus kexueae TaxID=2078952 RepID=UPI001FAEC5F1|nr:hypothetical protein [Bacillus kexueae]
MKRSWILLFSITLGTLIVAINMIHNVSNSTNNKDRIVVNGIENFNLTNSSSEDRYLLFYPADIRTSQEYTLVKEVSTEGKVLKEYEIRDATFRRMNVFQKPNEINKLYISFFGEAVIDNWYYTYDIIKHRFKKVDLSYFSHDVGVDHIWHFGTDVLFQTIVSHKTGDQNINDKGQFNMSISNQSTKISYETEYGYPPNWTPLLKLDKKIIYSGNGQVNDHGVPENAFIGIIDTDINSVEYINFNKQSNEFYPAYTTDRQAYIIGDNGKVYVLKKDLQYRTYEPFKDLPPQDYYYFIDGGGTLLLNDHDALHFVYNEITGPTLGILSFKEEPTFSVLDKTYIKEDHLYRILYQDTTNGEIYIIESDYDGSGNLLAIDNKSFELIHTIPVEYNHLLDFVIKK